MYAFCARLGALPRRPAMAKTVLPSSPEMRSFIDISPHCGGSDVPPPMQCCDATLRHCIGHNSIADVERLAPMADQGGLRLPVRRAARSTGPPRGKYLMYIRPKAMIISQRPYRARRLSRST